MPRPLDCYNDISDCCRGKTKECANCDRESECIAIEHKILSANTPSKACEQLAKLVALSLGQFGCKGECMPLAQPLDLAPLIQLLDPVSYMYRITIRNGYSESISLSQICSALASASGPFDVRRVSIKATSSGGTVTTTLGPLDIGDDGNLLEEPLCLQPCCETHDEIVLTVELSMVNCGTGCADDTLVPRLRGSTLCDLNEVVSVSGVTPCDAPTVEESESVKRAYCFALKINC